jgi:predicted acyltransferase
MVLQEHHDGRKEDNPWVPDAHRVDSLDVLRGLAVAGMIVVNNPGDWSAVFPPLLHTYWTGVTFADLVFPAFLFVMGIGMPFALARRRASGASTSDLYKHIGIRTVLLIALGLLLNVVSAWPDVSPLRFPGVLQRIALAYLIASPVLLHLRPSRWLAVAAALLIGHWALLVLVPFGGHLPGTMTPDDNLARFVDSLVLGRHALAIPMEPEGLLGTITATGSVLLGASVGEMMRRSPGDTVRLPALGAAATAALGIGLIWSYELPLSKPLWTGSFVLVTAGWTGIAFVVIQFVVEVHGWRRWCRPFVWLGGNALLIYVGSEIGRRLLDAPVIPGTTPKAWLFWRVLEPAFRPWPLEVASLVFASGVLTLWIAAGAALYRSRVVSGRYATAPESA